MENEAPNPPTQLHVDNQPAPPPIQPIDQPAPPPLTPPFEEPKKNNNLLILGIIAGFLCLVLVAILLWNFIKANSKTNNILPMATVTFTPAPQATLEDPTRVPDKPVLNQATHCPYKDFEQIYRKEGDWTKFTDSVYGYSFEYPSSLVNVNKYFKDQNYSSSVLWTKENLEESKKLIREGHGGDYGPPYYLGIHVLPNSKKITVWDKKISDESYDNFVAISDCYTTKVNEQDAIFYKTSVQYVEYHAIISSADLNYFAEFHANEDGLSPEKMYLISSFQFPK